MTWYDILIYINLLMAISATVIYTVNAVKCSKVYRPLNMAFAFASFVLVCLYVLLAVDSGHLPIWTGRIIFTLLLVVLIVNAITEHDRIVRWTKKWTKK